MKTAALAKIKEQFSKFPHDVAREEIFITHHGELAAVLIDFES